MRHLQGLEKLSFERINYFFGQVLGLNDFRDAQTYFLEKLRLHQRCLHGWGVVCGLEVSVKPGDKDPCAPLPSSEHQSLRRRAQDLRDQAENVAQSAKKLPAGPAQDELRKVVRTLETQARELESMTRSREENEDRPGRSARLAVSPGLALDPQGRDLVVSVHLDVDVWRALSPDDRRSVEAGGRHTLWVSLAFAETPTRAVRPISVDRCAPAGDQFSRIREATCVRISLTPPAADARCSPCCEPTELDSVLLARVDGYSLDEGLDREVSVDDGVRRMISLHDAATITGLSWTHGAKYGFDELARLLGRSEGHASGKNGPGLVFTFSREVDAESIVAPGVFEVLRYGGGGSPSGDLQVIPFKMDKPKERMVRRVSFRQASDERWSPGDRVHVKLRCDFVLDACCLPVDGNHVGGRVPLLSDGCRHDDDDDKDEKKKRGDHDERRCEGSPFRTGAWRSGNGTPGGTFESWFFVTARKPHAEVDR